VDGSIIAIEVEVRLQEWVRTIDPNRPAKPSAQPIAVKTITPSSTSSSSSSSSSTVPGYDPIGAPIGSEVPTVPLSVYTSPGYTVAGTSAVVGSLPAPVGGNFEGVPPQQIVGTPNG
jgi:hypothetical protein